MAQAEAEEGFRPVGRREGPLLAFHFLRKGRSGDRFHRRSLGSRIATPFRSSVLASDRSACNQGERAGHIASIALVGERQYEPARRALEKPASDEA